MVQVQPSIDLLHVHGSRKPSKRVASITTRIDCIEETSQTNTQERRHTKGDRVHTRALTRKHIEIKMRLGEIEGICRMAVVL